MQQVIHKIGIMMGIGAAHVILQVAALLHHLLELGHDQIVAALTVSAAAHAVIHFLTSIQAQHHIAHFLITEVHHFFIQQHTVGGQSKSEVFIVDLFLFPSIGHQLFHHFPVHQRLAAKKVHFQIVPTAGICNQKIQRLLAHLKTHDTAIAMVFTFFCKAVFAGQITIMGHMQAQSFYHGLTLFKVPGHIRKDVFRKQLSLLLQGFNILDGF